MSVFRNMTKADLWLDDPSGSRVFLRPDQTFVGTNYYKRFTASGAPSADEIFLELVQDDGTPYQTTSKNVPNLLRSWEFSVASGETWSDHNYIFTNNDLLGTEALFLQILVDDAPIEVRINDDSDSVFRMDADSSQVFNTGELLISQIAFRNPGLTGGLPASVRLMAAGVSAV